jgi:hypothetical protein
MSCSSSPDTPELEYTLNLGAESTPVTPRLDNVDVGVDVGVSAPVPPRTRSWRPAGHEGEQKARSTAYDAAGNLKVAVRGRRAAARDCGIWCVCFLSVESLND